MRLLADASHAAFTEGSERIKSWFEMTPSALNRSGQPTVPLNDLPTLAHPQVVNEDGYELDEAEIEALEQALGYENGAEGAVDMLDGDGDVEMAVNQPVDEEDGNRPKEPVLSLAERYVELLHSRHDGA